MLPEWWSELVTYKQGERCTYKGVRYEARFDLYRGCKPEGTHAEKFWKKVLIVLPKRASTR